MYRSHTLQCGSEVPEHPTFRVHGVFRSPHIDILCFISKGFRHTYVEGIETFKSEIVHESNTDVTCQQTSRKQLNKVLSSGVCRRSMLSPSTSKKQTPNQTNQTNEQQHLVRRGFLVLERVSGCRQTIDGDVSVAAGRKLLKFLAMDHSVDLVLPVSGA